MFVFNTWHFYFHYRILSIESSRISYLPPGVFDGMRKLVDLKELMEFSKL
jgi:hypothetical protein